MKDIIRNVLLANKARAVIRKDILESYIKFEVRDFIDVYQNYYSLLVIYNSSGILTYAPELLGNCELVKSETDKLSFALKKFESKEEYLKGRINLPKKELINKAFEYYSYKVIEEISWIGTENFKVISVDLFFEPVLLLMVSYRFKGKPQERLKFFIDDKNLVEPFYNMNFQNEYKLFVEQIAEYTRGVVWYDKE